MVALIGWAAVFWLLHDQIGYTQESIAAATWDDAGYLTDLGNLLVAIVFTAVTLGRRWAGAWWSGQATVVILLVGIGVWTIGREFLVFGTRGVGDMLAHGATPIAALMVWITAAPKVGLRWRDAVRWLAIPTGYLLYASMRGRLTGHYAYDWLNPSHGWVPVFAIVAILLAVTAAVGSAMIGWARLRCRSIDAAA